MDMLVYLSPHGRLYVESGPNQDGVPILNAIMDAFAAHSVMSKQALDSEKIRSGLKDVLLGPAQLYEALRARADGGARVAG